MSDFKYDNYDDQFEDNPSGVTNNNQQEIPAKDNEPQTFKVLVRQNKQKNETQSVNNKRATGQINKNQSRMSAETGNTKNKLIEQHLKLKSQLEELAQQMDGILEKQREKKNKKNHLQSVEDDERVVRLKEQLKEQQIRMNKHKNQIARLRKNMDSKYDLNKIVDKQNQLKHLKKQLHTFQQEQQSLEKIRRTQDKALKGSQDKQTMNKKSRMEEELREINHRTKKQIQSINQKQKHVRKLHETLIIKQAKVKEYQLKLKQKKSFSPDISEADIAGLEKQLKELENQKQAIEREGNERIRNLERQKKELKNELDRRKLILEQKEKQLRLNQMKHKEIVRLINSSQNSLHPNASTAQSRVSKENKSESKRTIAKNGRQAPKMEIEADYDADFQQHEELQQKTDQKEEQKEKQKQKKSAVEKHDYGFSADINDDDDIIAEV